MEAETTISPAALSPVLELSQSVTLIVRLADGSDVREIKLARPAILIGRRSLNDVALDDLTVSGQHAEIVQQGDGFEVSDLGSRNGTYVDGELDTSATLKPGSVIQTGIYRIEFQIDPVKAPPASSEEQVGVLEYLTGGMRGIKQRLEQPIVRVSASGQVVVVSRRKTGYFVTHLEGLNRPLLNGRSVSNRAVALNHDDVLEMNSTRIRFRLL